MSLLHHIGSCEHNDPPKRPSPNETADSSPTAALVSSVIELIYAGRPLTNHVRIPYGAFTGCSFCGAIAAQFENPANHTANCPLSRYFAAVEAVKKAVL